MKANINPLLEFPSENEIEASSIFGENTITVLIADDDPTNRMVLEGLLTNDGYAVLQAENGEEAVRIFEEKRPDLVLMDVMMPVMNGYDATTKIKAKCGERFIPVIFLTAITDENALAKCIESGGDDFLTKPYNHTILHARMEALLRITSLYNTVHKQRNQIMLHHELMEREARMAESLFSNIIKTEVLEKSYIKYLLSPMSLFNGDMLICAEKPSGGINVLLGDFTGHGMAAATGALPASSVFYEMTEKGYSVAEIAGEINEKMKRILPTGMFLAACIVDVNPVSRTMTIWNGGVPDVLIYSKEKQCLHARVVSTHLPMGILDSKSFDSSVEVIDVLDSDRMYIYSDGVVEANNLAMDMFGQVRLEELILAPGDDDSVITSIEKSLNKFCGDREQTDDVTLIEIRFDEDALNKGNVELEEAKVQTENTPSHWSMELNLEADVLKNSDPLPGIIQMFSELQGLKFCRQQLYTLVAEMYSNALEHGILGLDSAIKSSPEGFADYYHSREARLAELSQGSIKIKATHVPTATGGELTIRVEDSGPGFDFESNTVVLKDNNRTCGRGVPLIKTLCDSITHYGRGNIVEAVFTW